jgi:hypothetical protein
LRDRPHCEGPCSRSPSCRLPSCTRGASGRSLPWPARRRALRRRSTGSAQAGRPRTCAANDSEAPRREFNAAPPRQNPSAPFSTLQYREYPVIASQRVEWRLGSRLLIKHMPLPLRRSCAQPTAPASVQKYEGSSGEGGEPEMHLLAMKEQPAFLPHILTAPSA